MDKDVTEWTQPAQNNREEVNHQGPQTKTYSPEVRA